LIKGDGKLNRRLLLVVLIAGTAAGMGYAVTRKPMDNMALIQETVTPEYPDWFLHRHKLPDPVNECIEKIVFDEEDLPAGERVRLTMVCEAPRDEPFVRFPDAKFHTYQPLLGAHLVKHPDLGKMEYGQTYEVEGKIGNKGQICYSAFWIEVTSFREVEEAPPLNPNRF
jgi:hypothetical protein